MGFMGWDFIEAEINLDHPSKELSKKSSCRCFKMSDERRDLVQEGFICT